MATVTSAQLRADREAWKRARSLADLGELTAQWLEGVILCQPAYCDPEDLDPGETPGPDPETALLVPWLAAACRAGYVTSQSQPGATDWQAGESYQRAAAEGFCDLDAYVRLGTLAHEAGLIVIAHDPAKQPHRRLRLRGECCRCCTPLPGALPVSRWEGRAETWFGARRCRRDLRDIHVGYGECHPDAVKAILGAWQVTLIDPEWGGRSQRLWSVLQRFAETVGDETS